MPEACDAVGIPRCSTNDLRRSCAIWLGQAGVRDGLIEKAMGHKGDSVLGRHYPKLTEEDPLRLMEADLRKERAELRTAKADLRIGGSSGDGTTMLLNPICSAQGTMPVESKGFTTSGGHLMLMTPYNDFVIVNTYILQ